MSTKTNFPVSPHLLVFLSFALLLAAYVAIFGKFFPMEGYVMGHDYSLALPALLDGYFWFRNNGLSPPWFTPSFCAGQPFFADPQSGYYSLPQWLSFVVDPVTASNWTLLLSACLMFWGGYLLMRRVFLTGYPAALLVAGVLMFNAFLPYRMVIGHLGYHGFALAPWLALLLVAPIRQRLDSMMSGVTAGLLLAYWVQSGMGTIMIPAGLGVFAIALMYGMRGGELTTFFIRSGSAALVSLCLSASKLTAGLALLGNFPRDFYLLPGTKSLWDSIVMLFASMFLSGEHVFEIMSPRMDNVQWALMPHEWAFGFTLALAAAILLILGSLPWRSFRPVGARSSVLMMLLLACMSWPLAFNTYDPAWNAFLKALPILGKASTPTRWLIIYIPFVAVATGILLHLNHWNERNKWLIAIATLAGTVMLTASEPQGFYRSQGYDVRPILVADALTREGKLDPRINELGQEVKINMVGLDKRLEHNDTFVAGVSKVFCYNPIFGYRLEKFSAAGLEVGDVLKARDGYLNLKNPACYVFPEENGCQPGDRFRADQAERVKSFTAYRPFDFLISKRQWLANIITQWSGWIVVLVFPSWFVWNLLSRRKTAN